MSTFRPISEIVNNKNNNKNYSNNKNYNNNQNKNKNNSNIFGKIENSNNNVSKVNQLVIQTEAPDSIIDIFERKLSIRLALDKTFKEWAGRMLFFRLGGVTLEVIEGKDIKQNSKYFGIGWHAENYNKCYNDLVNDGFSLSEIRKGRKEGTLVSTIKEPILNIPTILIGLEE